MSLENFHSTLHWKPLNQNFSRPSLYLSGLLYLKHPQYSLSSLLRSFPTFPSIFPTPSCSLEVFCVPSRDVCARLIFGYALASASVGLYTCSWRLPVYPPC
jgi:hypothetical protein